MRTSRILLAPLHSTPLPTLKSSSRPLCHTLMPHDAMLTGGGRIGLSVSGAGEHSAASDCQHTRAAADHHATDDMLGWPPVSDLLQAVQACTCHCKFRLRSVVCANHLKVCYDNHWALGTVLCCVCCVAFAGVQQHEVIEQAIAVRTASGQRLFDCVQATWNLLEQLAGKQATR